MFRKKKVKHGTLKSNIHVLTFYFNKFLQCLNSLQLSTIHFVESQIHPQIFRGMYWRFLIIYIFMTCTNTVSSTIFPHFSGGMCVYSPRTFQNNNYRSREFFTVFHYYYLFQFLFNFFFKV